MKLMKFTGILLLLLSFSNISNAQYSGTYHPNPVGRGDFFGCELQQDGTIKLTMTIPSSARNMCEDFEGVMTKDAKGNFVYYFNDDNDSKNMIIGIVKSEKDLTNGLPKKIEVRTTNSHPCGVPKGKYTFEELGD